MQNLGNDIDRLIKELKGYKSLYDGACKEIDSLHNKLSIEEEINDKYRAWFTKNAHWTNEHNQRELSPLDLDLPKE